MSPSMTASFRRMLEEEAELLNSASRVKFSIWLAFSWHPSLFAHSLGSSSSGSEWALVGC